MEERFFILVVDDNTENLRIVSTILQEEGYKVAVALNGKNAIATLESHSFDLVLLDIMMPEMDGFEVCEIMKKTPNLQNIPVIFITAKTETEDIVKAFSLGGVDYITKPIKSKELLVRIETHLKIAKLQQQLANSNGKLEHLVERRTSQLLCSNAALSDKVEELKKANSQIEQSAEERKILQQQMTMEIIRSEAKERTRISQELHDGLGPILTTIKLYLQLIEKKEVSPDTKDLISQTALIANEAIIGIKEISNKLSPHVLTKYGLATAVDSFINKVKTTEAINFRINIEWPENLNSDIEILLYRVVIECINNTIKYAKASNIRIRISMENGSANLDYSDDGVGFDMAIAKTKKNSLGFTNIQNRVETLNGQFTMLSSEGTGMELHIKVPLNK